MQVDGQTLPENAEVNVQNDGYDVIYMGEPADAGAPARHVIRTKHHDDDRPAPIRIAELFVHMQPHKRVLRGILEQCLSTPHSHDDVFAHIEELSAKHRSVYSPENFCDLLAKSGAFKKVTEEGEDYPEGDPEPRTVVIDGVEYLEPVELPELYYIATPDGANALKDNESTSPMEELFDKEFNYRPIYLKLLEMCAAEEGSTMPQLDAAIINDPLVQEPRYYATRFISNLETVGAVSWEPGWHITDIGLKGIELLASGSSAVEEG